MASYDDTATVSGSVVGFSNGADSVPLKNWLVTLPASLDGYTEVNGVQIGKNLFDYEAVQAFNANVIITRNDGDYTMQNNNSYAVGAFRGISFHLKPANYSMSLGEAITVPIRIYKNGSWFNNGINAGNTSCTFTVTEEADYDFSCNVAANSSLTIKKCQFEVGSTATAYEAYEAPTQYTASLGRTIYGGTADIVTGEGEAQYGYIVFDGSNDENWGGYSAYNGYYIGISDMKSGTRQDGVCNQLTCSKSNAQGQTDAFWLGVGNKNFYVIGVYDSMGNTLEAFKAYLAENPLILVYPLATPTDFTFAPITPTPETAKGSNTFWSDQGNTELTYYKSGYGFTSVTVHKETPEGEPVEETRKLHRIIYEGQVDVINGTGLIFRGESGTQYDPPEQISFTPIEIATDEGENTLYADEGDSAITYRKAVD